jgi:hypothetical protein
LASRVSESGQNAFWNRETEYRDRSLTLVVRLEAEVRIVAAPHAHRRLAFSLLTQPSPRHTTLCPELDVVHRASIRQNVAYSTALQECFALRRSWLDQ